MSKVYTIYRAYHRDSNRSYIGFDSCWPKRQQVHKYKSRQKTCQYFHHALKKYGWDAFDWEILYTSFNRDECLEKEKYFIQEHDSFNNGFNLTLGGEGTVGRQHSPETIAKIRESNRGKKVSEETRKLLSEKKKGSVSPNKGRKFSEEHKQKLAAAKLGRKRDEETKQKISKKLKGRTSPNKGKMKNIL